MVAMRVGGSLATALVNAQTPGPAGRPANPGNPVLPFDPGQVRQPVRSILPVSPDPVWPVPERRERTRGTVSQVDAGSGLGDVGRCRPGGGPGLARPDG